MKDRGTVGSVRQSLGGCSAAVRLTLLAVLALGADAARTHYVTGWIDNARQYTTEGETVKFTVLRDEWSGHLIGPEYMPTGYAHWKVDFSSPVNTASPTDFGATSGIAQYRRATDDNNAQGLSGDLWLNTADDDIVEGTETFTMRMTRFEHKSHAPDGLGVSQTVTGVIYDNDIGTVTISNAAAEEGEKLTFTLTLDNEVQGGFTVTPNYFPSSSTRFTPNTTPIAFAGTAGETQSFDVQTVENTTGGEGHAYISVGLTFSDTTIGNAHLNHGNKFGAGTIYDDDDSTVRVAIDDASALEGDDLVFTAYINDVSIPPFCGAQLKLVPTYTNGTAGATDYTRNTQTIKFPPGINPLLANSRQTFSVSTAEDAVREGDETFTVGFTVDESDVQQGCPNDWVVVGPAATGTILEDDYETVSLSLSPTAISEEGGATRVRASLNRASPADTTVTVAPAPNGEYTLSSNRTLRIRQGQTASTGTVRIRAVGNRTATGDRTVAVSATAANTSTVYQPADATLTLTDDDTAGVTLSRTAFEVVEGAAGSAYTVVLDAQPTANVTIAVAKGSGGDADLTASPASLTFGGSNWNVPQTVTVTAAADADYAVGTATFTHTVTSTDALWDGLTVADLTATERDTTYGFVTSIESAEVPEGGSVDYTVRLKTRPTCGTRVRIQRSGDSDLSANRSSVYFNSGSTSWKTEKTVTLRAREDSDSLSGGATFRHYTTSCDSNYKGHEFEMPVVEVDNEAGVVISPVALAVAEGSSATYTVRLQTLPTADVTVAVAKGTGGDADLTLSGSTSLTFTTTNWGTAQSVTVAAAEDGDGLDGSATLTHTATSSDGAYNGVTIPDLAATEADNDRKVRIDVAGQIQVGEGSSAEYSVKLSKQPSGDVTVAVARKSGDADITASPSSLTFTTANWDTYQTVTAAAAEDVDVVDGTAVIGHVPSGGGWSADEGVELTVHEADNRIASLIGGSGHAVTSLTVPEGGSATYQVALQSAPTAEVTVAVANRGGTGDDADLTASPTALTFTTTNWEDSQTVTVSAAEDADGTNGSAVIRHTVTSSDAGYDGLTLADVTATESDNDAANVTLSDTVVTVDEGSSATYTAKLSMVPSANVTVTVSGSGDADLAVSPASLTFTTTDWGTAQTVTVSAAEDADKQDGSATFTHSASGGGYGSAAATLQAVEADNDPELVPTVAATTAAVRIENHESGWWYSTSASGATGTAGGIVAKNAAALGTCERSTLDTVHLAGLAAGRTYTVTAYGSSDCSAASELDRVSFTTPGGPGGQPGTSPSAPVCSPERPTATGVALASAPAFGDAYAAGDAILIAATFSEPVKAFGAGPTLRFHLGGEARTADYHSGSGTGTLNFRYLVAEGDAGGLEVPADALGGNRGRIHDLCGLSVVDALIVEPLVLAVRVNDAAQVPLLPPAGDAMGRQGFVRVINHSAEAGELSVTAIDDAGNERGPVTLAIGANASTHFNTADLEGGNAAKGLSGATGAGQGSWRLKVKSALQVEAIGHVRHADGFLTAMNSVAPVRDGAPWVATFNPASNTRQASRLRLFNAGGAPAAVRVTGTDDAGRASGGAVGMVLSAGAAADHDASSMESGSGLEGALGDGAGKWRLAVGAPPGVAAMSLMESPSGHLANLSTAPAHRHRGALVVPLFLSASDPHGRQGFVRVLNRSDEAGTVSIQAFDDSAWDYDPVTLSIGAGRAVHLNSNDLELSNAAKGLSGSTGPASAGDWQLRLTSGLDIEALTYVRHADGFLTSMHDVAPKRGGVHRVATFNPASNLRQRSLLRIVNLGDEAANVAIKGIDGNGASPGSDVTATVPAGGSLTLDAKALEEGGEGLEGALGDGASKWRLLVTSEQDILVMSLMQSPTGHLANLSARPMRAD